MRGTTVPMSRLRKVVAERAVVSMQSMAQLTTVVEADVTRVAALRDQVKGEFLAKTGLKLSFLPFFALAAAEALRAYPIINATIDGENIVYPDHEHVSIAVDTERGLLTPVIRNAGDLDIAGLAREIADLAERTRENKLKPDELAGGTFTLTNTGSRGALFDTPVVFLPQVAILGTGIVVEEARRRDRRGTGRDRGALHGVPRALLRPSHRGRRRRGTVPDDRQGSSRSRRLRRRPRHLGSRFIRSDPPSGLAPHHEERGRIGVRAESRSGPCRPSVG